MLYEKSRKFLLAAMFTAMSAGLAQACIQTPDDPPPTEVYCMGVVDGKEMVQVILRNYTTFAESEGFCACALNVPLTFGEVIAAQIVYSDTSVPLPGFNFAPNPNSQFPGDFDFQGFSSSVSTAISGGLAVDLIFYVVSKRDNRICNALAEHFESADAIAATDQADKNGKPVDKHMSFFKPKGVKVGDFKDCRQG